MHALLHSERFQVRRPQLERSPLAFVFRISLIVSLFLTNTYISSAQTVAPVPVQGTCRAFAREVIKGLRPTNGQCETGKPVRGRCPGDAGQTTYTLDRLQNFTDNLVTSGYYCSCNGKFNTSADKCTATCSGGPGCSVQQCIAIQPPAVCL